MDMGYRLLSQRVAHRHPLIPSYLIKYSRFWWLPFLFSALASTIRCTFNYSLWSLGTSDAGLRVLEADIHAASSGSYNVSTFWTPRFYIATFSHEFPSHLEAWALPRQVPSASSSSGRHTIHVDLVSGRRRSGRKFAMVCMCVHIYERMINSRLDTDFSTMGIEGRRIN